MSVIIGATIGASAGALFGFCAGSLLSVSVHVFGGGSKECTSVFLGTVVLCATVGGCIGALASTAFPDYQPRSSKSQLISTLFLCLDIFF